MTVVLTFSCSPGDTLRRSITSRYRKSVVVEWREQRKHTRFHVNHNILYVVKLYLGVLEAVLRLAGPRLEAFPALFEFELFIPQQLRALVALADSGAIVQYGQE